MTLTKPSGTAYPNAKLQLVAGDVNRVRDEMRMAATDPRQMRAEAAAPAQQMAQEALFEYHLYTLQRPTTIADNQTKQVALLSAAGVPVTKELLLQGSDYYYRSSVGDIGQKLKVGVFVQFENRESRAPRHADAEGRGARLQEGQRRQRAVRRRGPHRPHAEEREGAPQARRRLRRHRRQEADRLQAPRADQPASYVFESAYEIVLRNAKKEAADRGGARAGAGRLDACSRSRSAHAKVAAGTAEWRIKVPADGSTTLRYRVLVRY